jgi:hypothetical protein
MRKKLCFVALFFCATTTCFAIQKRLHQETKTYELYSWQDAKGIWTFGLFPGVSNAGLHPDYIMRQSSALTGLEKLKGAVAMLPVGSEILWLDHGVGMWKKEKGWERIKFPPAEVIADIRKFCETKRYKLSIDQQKK